MTTKLHGNFTDIVALVTGSTRGIGSAIARRFATNGASAVVTGCSDSEGQAVVDEIEQASGSAVFVQADLRNPKEIYDLIQNTTDRFGQIDVLVNNAAVQTETTVTEASLDDWQKVIETNFRAYWLTVKHAVEQMPAGSSVVNVSSNHAYNTMPRMFPYNAVKAGIEGMTRAMAVDLGKLGIRVNAVTPGWVQVERTKAELSEADIQHLEAIHPVGRIGEPEDVAGTVLWLASDDAAFVTGSSILVDGGRGAVMQDDKMSEYQSSKGDPDLS